jgi:CBS domain containing-hemolysin-like protein
MSKGEIFTFILCLCVLLALTAFFVFLFTVIFKLNKKIVNNGVDDQRIIADYEKRRKKRKINHSKLLKPAFQLQLF